MRSEWWSIVEPYTERKPQPPLSLIAPVHGLPLPARSSRPSPKQDDTSAHAMARARAPWLVCGWRSGGEGSVSIANKLTENSAPRYVAFALGMATASPDHRPHCPPHL